jgi:hypothetical protein
LAANGIKDIGDLQCVVIAVVTFGPQQGPAIQADLIEGRKFAHQGAIGMVEMREAVPIAEGEAAARTGRGYPLKPWPNTVVYRGKGSCQTLGAAQGGFEAVFDFEVVQAPTGVGLDVLGLGACYP